MQIRNPPTVSTQSSTVCSRRTSARTCRSISTSRPSTPARSSRSAAPPAGCSRGSARRATRRSASTCRARCSRSRAATSSRGRTGSAWRTSTSARARCSRSSTSCSPRSTPSTQLIDVEEQRLFLRHVSRCMKSPGVLALDCFCPLPMLRPEANGQWREIERDVPGPPAQGARQARDADPAARAADPGVLDRRRPARRARRATAATCRRSRRSSSWPRPASRASATCATTTWAPPAPWATASARSARTSSSRSARAAEAAPREAAAVARSEPQASAKYASPDYLSGAIMGRWDVASSTRSGTLHTVRELPGGQTQLFIGLHLIHEVTSPQGFQMLRRRRPAGARARAHLRDRRPHHAHRRPGPAARATRRPRRCCRRSSANCAAARHPLLRDRLGRPGHRARDRPRARAHPARA